MYDYDPDAWIKMITTYAEKHARHLAHIDFWVEHLELYDRNGNVSSQPSPRLVIDFKGA